MHTISRRWHQEVFFILVYDSVGKPGGRPECSRDIITEPSTSEFEVGEQPLKLRCGGGLPGKAATWMTFRVGFHHKQYIFSVHMHSCFCNVSLYRC